MKVKFIHIMLGLAILLVSIPTQNGILDSVVLKDAYSRLDYYGPLIERLLEKGLDSDVVKTLFLDPRVEFYPQVLATNLQAPDVPEINMMEYQRSEQKNVEYFVKKYRRELMGAERKYHVNRSVIAAILYVETKLGHIIGRYNTFNVLSSLALAGTKQFQPVIEEYVHEKYHYLDYSKRLELIMRLKERARSRGEWAFRELVELILIHQETEIDVLEIRGSWAGAFGLPQFMPSSYRHYAVDGNHDGIIDLYNITDAIFSIANYLKHAGWQNSAPLYSKKRAIWRYNHSAQYVNNVLTIANSLD